MNDKLGAYINKLMSTIATVTVDDEGDEFTEQIFRELLSFMIENPQTIPRAMRLSFIAKYIERIADHATNIGELVVYMVEGRIIRHTLPSPME